MIFLFIALAVAAALVAHGTLLFPVAVLVVIVAIWANGVIANFGRNPWGSPRAAILGQMISALGALTILVVAGILRIAGAGTVNWEDAHSHVGDSKKVCGPLVSVVESEGDTFLNVGRDYPDDDRFTIVVWNTTAETAPASGARVCMRGEIINYEGVAQITTSDWDDLDIR